jgi:RNA polymerase sigma-70 factor, ECF subfamily
VEEARVRHFNARFAQADVTLVRLCLKGRKESFDELSARYYQGVYGYLLRRVSASDVAEDLAQETFLEAFRALPTCREPEHFSSWLFGIAHHRCGKWLRSRRDRPFPIGEAADDPSSSESEEAAESRSAVVRNMTQRVDQLSEGVREILRLKHEEGKTCEEIARALGRPVGTIKSLLSRTHRALRAFLTPRLSCSG